MRKESYPTMAEVEAASRYDLCYWWRFLDSPGMEAIGMDSFEDVLNRQVVIMNRIKERMDEVGGFTPEISKSLGW